MRVLFYDDTSLFGGHETTALTALRYLGGQTGLDLSFAYNLENTKLAEGLKQLCADGSRISLHALPFTATSRFDNYLAWFSPRPMGQLRNLLQAVRPDLVVAVQGSIGTSFRGVLAAHRFGCPAVSFLPMAHTPSSLGAKLGRLRDWMDSFAYRLPDAYITQNAGCRTDLQQIGVEPGKIHVAYYGLNLGAYPIFDRLEARDHLGWPRETYLVAAIARVDFFQKGQDVLVEAWSRHRDKLSNIRLLIVGDGPDLGKLKETVRDKNLDALVEFIPWSNDLPHIYSAIDMILLPSRHEGLPVIVLEAMLYGLPIAGSAISGLAEVLPPSWLFTKEDPDDLVTTLLRMKDEDNSQFIEQNRERIRQEWTMENYGRAFQEALQGIAALG